eukprot:1652783-Lingulodinium_polyedra.AAC.1
MLRPGEVPRPQSRCGDPPCRALTTRCGCTRPRRPWRPPRAPLGWSSRLSRSGGGPGRRASSHSRRGACTPVPPAHCWRLAPRKPTTSEQCVVASGFASR